MRASRTQAAGRPPSWASGSGVPRPAPTPRSFLGFLLNCMLFLSFSASLMGDVEGILEMVFLLHPPLLRGHWPIPERSSDGGRLPTTWK